MKEQTYLERQEAAAKERLRRALTGIDGEPPTEFVERVTREHPFVAVCTAVALGGVAGALLGRVSSGTLLSLAKLGSKPAWRTVRRFL